MYVLLETVTVIVTQTLPKSPTAILTTTWTVTFMSSNCMYERFSGRRTAAWSRLWFSLSFEMIVFHHPSRQVLERWKNPKQMSSFLTSLPTHTHTHTEVLPGVLFHDEQYCTGMRYWFETCEWIISALQMIKESIGTQRAFLITAKSPFPFTVQPGSKNITGCMIWKPFSNVWPCPKESVTHTGPTNEWFIVW